MHVKTSVKLLGCVILGLMGFAANWYELELFTNIDLLAGSFFVMLAILGGGGVHAVVAGLIAASCTFFLWNHPWSMVLFTLESLFAAVLYEKRRGNLVIYDIVFWVCLGMPLGYFFHHYLLGTQPDTSTLIVLKQAVNGVFNTLMAVLAYVLLQLFGRSSAGERMPYSQLLFVVMASLVIIPAAFFFLKGTRAYADRERAALASKVSYTSEIARNSLANWISEHRQNVQTLAAIVGNPDVTPVSEMQHYVETLKAAAPAYKKLGVLDKNAVTVAYYPLMDENGRSNLGIDFSDREYLSILKEKKKPFIPDILMGRLGHPAPVVALLAPIVISGEYRGFCSGVIDISHFYFMLENLAQTDRINLSLVDGSGKVIASTIRNLEVMDRFLRPFAGKDGIEANEIVHWLPNSKPGAGAMTRWKDSLLISALPLSPEFGWKVVVEASFQPVIENVTRTGIFSLALLGILILVTVALSHIFSKGFVSTIVKLQAATRSFPKRIDNAAPIEWPESKIKELAALSNNFRDMASALIADVRERKRAEEERQKLEAMLHQSQKMEAIGTLAGGIAHDFNNILAAIMGYTELSLMGMSEQNPVRHNLQQVFNAAIRARDLVKQILVFSRMKAEDDRKTIELGPVVKETLQLLRASLPSTIEIRTNIADGDNVAQADPTRIHQLITNLCTNSFHAMEESGGILEVSLVQVRLDAGSVARHQDLKSGRYLKLTVSDTGRGIPPEIMARIFDPYFTTKGPGKGSGLGLAVVHGIVQRLHGAIEVFSWPMKGTTFHIYLPSMEVRAPRKNDADPDVPHGTEKILIVDDEEVLAEVERKMLECLGYEVTSRTDGKDALELFSGKPDYFDLVITDYTMPNITGAVLAREMIRIRPGLPVILCTGFTDRMNSEKARDIGIREVLMKPLNQCELARAVRNVLDT